MLIFSSTSEFYSLSPPDQGHCTAAILQESPKATTVGFDS
jgi:hypothetical protein